MEKLNLKGGYGDDGCCCGCHGPSSTWDNQNANVQLTSPGGCHNCNCGCFEWDAEVATNFMHA